MSRPQGVKESRNRRPKGSGGITKNSRGYYVATYTWRDEDDVLHRKTFSHRKKTGAEDRLKDWLAAGGPGAHKSRGKTLGMLVEHVLDKVLPVSGKASPDTIKGYRSYYELYIKGEDFDLASMRLEKLRVQHLDRVAQIMQEEGLSSNTVKKVHNFIRQCVREGYRLGWIAEPIHDRMTTISARVESEKDAYTFEELMSIVAALEGHRTQPGVMIGGFLGLRPGEVVRLRWQDFDFEGKTLLVRGTKSEASWARIPVPDFIFDYLNTLKRSSVYLIPDIKTGGATHIHRDTYYHEVREVVEAAGIRWLTNHEHRHTAGTALARLGVPLLITSKILRHSSASVTEQYYLHLKTEDLREAMNKLDAFYQTHRNP